MACYGGSFCGVFMPIPMSSIGWLVFNLTVTFSFFGTKGECRDGIFAVWRTGRTPSLQSIYVCFSLRRKLEGDCIWPVGVLPPHPHKGLSSLDPVYFRRCAPKYESFCPLFFKSGGVRGGTPINLSFDKYPNFHMRLPWRKLLLNLQDATLSSTLSEVCLIQTQCNREPA